MNESKAKIKESDRKIFRQIRLLLFYIASFVFNLYALYFIGTALIKIEFDDLVASPLLFVISFCAHELKKYYA